MQTDNAVPCDFCGILHEGADLIEFKIGNRQFKSCETCTNSNILNALKEAHIFTVDTLKDMYFGGKISNMAEVLGVSQQNIVNWRKTSNFLVEGAGFGLTIQRINIKDTFLVERV